MLVTEPPTYDGAVAEAVTEAPLSVGL